MSPSAAFLPPEPPLSRNLGHRLATALTCPRTPPSLSPPGNPNHKHISSQALHTPPPLPPVHPPNLPPHPSLTTTTATSPPSPHAAIRLPPACHASSYTGPECSYSTTSVRRSTSQTHTLPSLLPVARSAPSSGENATE